MIRPVGLALALAACAFSARAEEIGVVKAGRYEGMADCYRVGTTYYLGAHEAARLYGGRVYWYAVSGRIQLSLHGTQIGFQGNSDQVKVGTKTVRLSYPVLVRVGKAFIPMDFFVSEDFSQASNMESKFDPSTHLLSLTPRSTVGPLKWSSQTDHTRIVLRIEEGLGYTLDKRGRKGFEVSIPKGTIDQAEKMDIHDGVVAYANLEQDSKRARLLVKLGLDSADYRVLELTDPRRLVIDVPRPQSAPPLRQAKSFVKAVTQTDDDAEAAEPQPLEDVLSAPVASTASARAATAAQPMTPNVSPVGASGRAATAAQPREVYRPVRRRIAIDPGHGGKDTGATGRRGSVEKDINLAVARELAGFLKKERAFDVILTRGSDVFVPLGDRSRIANEFGADLFVSIHCNAHSRKSESGFEIYVLSEKASDPEAERLAEFENSVLTLEGKDVSDASNLLYALAKTEFINDAAELSGRMAKSLSKRVDLADRGVKQAAFYVLRGASEPAVLVEMGFLSNPKDEAKLRSKSYRHHIVEGLYSGILSYAKAREWTSSGKKL